MNTINEVSQVTKESLLKEINAANVNLKKPYQGAYAAYKPIDLIQMANQIFKENMIECSKVGLGDDPYSKIKKGIYNYILNNKEFSRFINSNEVIKDEFINIYRAYQNDGFPIPSNEIEQEVQRKLINNLFEYCYKLEERQEVTNDELKDLGEKVNKINNYYKSVSLNPNNSIVHSINNLFGVVKSLMKTENMVTNKRM